MNPIIIRLAAAMGLIIMGLGFYRLVNALLLSRASRKRLGMGNFQVGVPGILYFT